MARANSLAQFQRMVMTEAPSHRQSRSPCDDRWAIRRDLQESMSESTNREQKRAYLALHSFLRRTFREIRQNDFEAT